MGRSLVTLLAPNKIYEYASPRVSTIKGVCYIFPKRCKDYNSVILIFTTALLLGLPRYFGILYPYIYCRECLAYFLLISKKEIHPRALLSRLINPLDNIQI